MEARQSIIDIVKSYIISILDEVSGIKALVLDAETTNIVSLVCPKSTLLSYEVFLIEKITQLPDYQMPYMKGIFLLRATEENKAHLLRLMKSPIFSEYYFYFTNIPVGLNPQAMLQDLATTDEKSVVKVVQEVYADFCVLNKELFTLGMDSAISLEKSKERWTAVENVLLNRMTEGLLATLLATRKNPVIRYQRTSDVCKMLAKSLTVFMLVAKRQQEKIGKEVDLFERNCGASPNTLLLIINRKEDPITPLLNQWTYEAMIHELIGISRNRVDVKKMPGGKSSTETPELVLSVDTDQFYANNLYSGYGELAANLKVMVDKLQAKTNEHRNIDTLEDMQRILDNYPEYKKESANVYKHVDLMTSLSRTVETKKLLDVSKVEQAIAVSESRDEHFKVWLLLQKIFEQLINDMIQNKEIEGLDKLRLVLLFALRYDDDPKLRELIKELEKENVQSTNMIDMMMKYAGKEKRKLGLTSEGGFVERFTKVFKEAFKGIPNVFTQHKSLMYNVVEAAIKGTLKDLDYPTFTTDAPKGSTTDIIVFIIGGATYQEAREVAQFNAQGCNVLLGSTNMHNSKSFLADIKFFYGQPASNTIMIRPEEFKALQQSYTLMHDIQCNVEYSRSQIQSYDSYLFLCTWKMLTLFEYVCVYALFIFNRKETYISPSSVTTAPLVGESSLSVSSGMQSFPIPSRQILTSPSSPALTEFDTFRLRIFVLLLDFFFSLLLFPRFSPSSLLSFESSALATESILAFGKNTEVRLPLLTPLAFTFKLAPLPAPPFLNSKARSATDCIFSVFFSSKGISKASLAVALRMAGCSRAASADNRWSGFFFISIDTRFFAISLLSQSSTLHANMRPLFWREIKIVFHVSQYYLPYRRVFKWPSS
eukprot:TRINITY_DN370_c3_g1_i1.p1 TRINITY_DN370_c3_g1~~TRINITY_DN370_c3_g1_i1.p1  ORF type:complete len:880 (+),score=79.34 TRINITY_DN370_c3_g1_i1:3525-6164(+)